MVLPLPGQVVVEVVQHGLPDYLVVGHGQEQEGAGLLVGGLGLPDDLVVGHGQEQEGVVILWVVLDLKGFSMSYMGFWDLGIMEGILILMKSWVVVMDNFCQIICI